MDSKKQQINHTQLFINNEYVLPQKKQVLDVINPATEEVITQVSIGTKEDIDIAVQAAQEAKKAWLKVPLFERGDCLYKFALLLEQNIDEIAQLESLDNGKCLNDSLEDVRESAKLFKHFAGWTDKIDGRASQVTDNLFCHTRREPVGIVGLIAPWNYPLMMAAWKLAPALAAGNTVVFKPSEITPLSAIRIGEFFKQSGFPAGVVNIITGLGQEVGEAISRHPKIDKVSFTGSGVTGRKVMKASAETNLKKITLELGGKSPTVVYADADLDKAATEVFFACMVNTGQNCVAGSRCFVQDTIYEEFLKKVAQCQDKVILDTNNKQEGLGPLTSKDQYNKVMSYIETAKKEGLQLLMGGERFGEKGYYVKPTIYKNVPDKSQLAVEEIFGPVLVIMQPFKTEDEVIERANNTVYGLGAGVFTTDMNKVERFTRDIRAGTVWVNTYNGLLNHMPFGGHKESGFGKDMGLEALEAVTVVKTVFNQFNL